VNGCQCWCLMSRESGHELVPLVFVVSPSAFRQAGISALFLCHAWLLERNLIAERKTIQMDEKYKVLSFGFVM
jgi:hypothetical protein